MQNIAVVQQFGGYGGYHGTQQDSADANGDMSPTSSKQPHLSRELQRLLEGSVNMPDAHKGSQTAASSKAHAHSLPDGKHGSAEDGKRRYGIRISHVSWLCGKHTAVIVVCEIVGCSLAC